jgi:hypothetical protein
MKVAEGCEKGFVHILDSPEAVERMCTRQADYLRVGPPSKRRYKSECDPVVNSQSLFPLRNRIQHLRILLYGKTSVFFTFSPWRRRPVETRALSPKDSSLPPRDPCHICHIYPCHIHLCRKSLSYTSLSYMSYMSCHIYLCRKLYDLTLSPRV